MDDQDLKNDLHESKMQKSYDDYYAPMIKTIMVPVQVKYHEPTDIIYSFVPPTLKDVERAYEEDWKREVEERNK